MFLTVLSLLWFSLRGLFTPSAVRTQPTRKTYTPPPDPSVGDSALIAEHDPAPTLAIHAEKRRPENFQVQSLVAIVDDRSGSTAGDDAEYSGVLSAFADLLHADVLSAFHILIADVQFGDGQVKTTPFTQANEWRPKNLLSRHGDTPLGRALKEAMALIRRKQAELRQAGVQINRTIMFVLTDGGATDGKDYAEATQDLQKAEQDEKLICFPIALGRFLPDLHRLSRKREAAIVEKGKYGELFKWAADFLARVSASQPNEEVPVGSLTGWVKV